MINRQRIARLELVLGTLISWMGQSGNSPIRMDEARKLLEMLSDEKPIRKKKGTIQ